MKTAQLIKRTETIIYKDENGEILNLTSHEKLLHSLNGKNIVTMITEEIVERWHYKTKKEIQKKYYDYCSYIDNPFDYYIVYAG